MANNTKVRLKRSAENYVDLGEELIAFGEPLFIDNGSNGSARQAYIAVGAGSKTVKEDTEVANAPLFKAFGSKTLADSIVFNNNGALITEDGTEVATNRITATGISSLPAEADKYLLLTQPLDDTTVCKFDLDNHGIYVTKNGVLYGGAWNDYAEVRNITEQVEPGMVVCEDGTGALIPSSQKLQPCAYVVSDTYGFSLGTPDEKTAAVAVSGRVLVSIDGEVELGDCVCAGPNGHACKMSRQEISLYPDRILGAVTEIPSYEEWNGVPVNGRIWIKVM